MRPEREAVSMEREDLIETFEDAGLSPYQADAYVALLEMGSGLATEIADESGVPMPRIYDVLRGLEREGYIETYEQESLKARAHNPDEVLSDLQDRAERYLSAANEIEKRWEQPHIEDSNVSIVKRFDTVLQQARDEITSATDLVQVSVPLDNLDDLRPALRTARGAGASVKLSVFTEIDDDRTPSSDEVADICTEARYREIPSPFVVIVDRSITCFAPHAGSINEYGVLVNDPSHAYVFHWFFLTCLWDVWEAFYRSDDESVVDEYVDLRYAIRDLKPLFEAGREIRVRVSGLDTESRVRREIEGTLQDVVTSESLNWNLSTDVVPIAAYAGLAMFSVDTGDDVVDVGGWGATLEDMEAKRITVLEVE